MIIRNIAAKVADMLQYGELAAAAADTEGSVERAAKTLFISALEQAANECAVDFPTLKKKTVNASGGTIALFGIDTGIVTAVHKVTRRGVPVAFTFDSMGVHVVGDGAYTVYYTTSVGGLGMDGSLELGAGMDESMLEYMVARNICLSLGRTEEASIWDGRYHGVAEERRIRRRARIPAREFI